MKGRSHKEIDAQSIYKKGLNSDGRLEKIVKKQTDQDRKLPLAVTWNPIIHWQSASRTISVIDGFHDIVMRE